MSGSDPITTSVIQSALVSISREMGVTLRRTAYSDIFNEGSDFSCGLFDAQGRLTAQGEFLPLHLGALQYAVRQAVAEMRPRGFEPGDAVILNDPYRGGTHLPDLTAITPIFIDNEVRAFAANRAHHGDVGGAVAGSFVASAYENFQEGIRVPPVKIYRAGRIDPDVLELILNNVRVPTNMRGDLEAQLSANRTAVTRYAEVAARYGSDVVADAITDACASSERRMRQVIATWPDGSYYGEDFLDNDGHRDEPILVAVTLIVRGDQLLVDFSGTAKQVLGPVNSVLGMTASSVYLALQAAADPTIPSNDGSYRPFEINAPLGSLVNPTFPAACTGGNETSHRIVNAIMRALSVMPAGPRFMASDHGSSNNLIIVAQRPDGSPAILYQYPEGAWGSVEGKDGESALFSLTGNCRNMPAEALELGFPIRLRRYELRQDSGGAGRWRGGLGTRRDYELLADQARLSFLSDRCKVPPFGLRGGAAGAPGAYLVDRGEGLVAASPTFLSKGVDLPLKAGDIVSQQTAGGGGLGAPRDRPLAEVLADVREGYVSPAGAVEEYGIDPAVLDGTVPPAHDAALTKSPNAPRGCTTSRGGDQHMSTASPRSEPGALTVASNSRAAL